MLVMDDHREEVSRDSAQIEQGKRDINANKSEVKSDKKKQAKAAVKV